MAQVNPLAPHIPAAFQEVADMSFGPVHIYRHEPTGLPLAALVGGHRGQVIGGILYFRAQDDSMNLEVEAPMDTLGGVVAVAEKMMAETKPCDTIDGLWTRFLDNVLGQLAQKRAFAADGSPVPIVPTAAAPQAERADHSDAAPEPAPRADHSDAAPECMVCLDARADTIVQPCGHCVVCAACSRQLEHTADARVCCQCRCAITRVVYRD